MKKLVIALGNPGKEYKNTYHNAGWLMLDWLLRNDPAAAAAKTWKKHKDFFEYTETDNGDIAFVRPLTFMNELGKAAREAMKKFGVKAADVIVIHDDSDIVIGEYKISTARNSAGHKGVQSIIDALKTNAFTRIRIGIRPAKEAHRQKASEFALKQISAANRKNLDRVFKEIASNHELYL